MPNIILEDTPTVTAADLEVFAHILQGERNDASERVEAEPLQAESEPILAHVALQQQQARWEREQELLNRLLIDFKRKWRQRKFCLRAFALTGGTALVAGVAMMVNGGLIDTLLAPFEWLAACAVGVMGIGSGLHGQMTVLVANIPESDVRAIGPLLEAMRYADMQGIPQRALKELLPLLTPADAVLFTDAHRQSLHLALDDVNTDLVVLLLGALEKIGDGRSIGPVTRLANGNGRARVDPQVLRAAQHCLPLLEARAVYDTANHTLLRASAMEPETGAGLLRSVDDCSDPAPRELLHPAHESTP